MVKKNLDQESYPSKRQVLEWVDVLYTRGLVGLPCWGCGNAMPWRDHKALADSPPSRDAVVGTDYSGGLSILLGTQHPLGGFVIGVDLDQGPASFPWRPHGFLLLERGTALGKWHVYLHALDRLEGQVNLRDSFGELVCEVKGRGCALRAWPTMPPGKPQGYQVVDIVTNPTSDPPLLMAQQVIDALADFLSVVLERPMAPDPRRATLAVHGLPVPAGLAARVELSWRARGSR